MWLLTELLCVATFEWPSIRRSANALITICGDKFCRQIKVNQSVSRCIFLDIFIRT